MTNLVYLFLMSCPLLAQDLGTYGETRPIAERPMSAMFQEGLKSLSSQDKKNIKQRIIDQVKNPPPVSGLLETKTYRSWEFDPSIEVTKAIQDEKGNVLIAQGTTVNPLDALHIEEKPLLFLNGTNPDHIAWAKTASKQAKWIFVKGSPVDAQYNRPIFFDQGGRITRHFGIQHVPCRISQRGKTLLIEEIPINFQLHKEKCHGRKPYPNALSKNLSTFKRKSRP